MCKNINIYYRKTPKEKAESALITNIPLLPEGFPNSLTPVWVSKTFMHLKLFTTHSNMPQKGGSVDFLPSNLNSNTFPPTGICRCSRMIHFGRQWRDITPQLEPWVGDIKEIKCCRNRWNEMKPPHLCRSEQLSSCSILQWSWSASRKRLSYRSEERVDIFTGLRHLSPPPPPVRSSYKWLFAIMHKSNTITLSRDFESEIDGESLHQSGALSS